MLNERIIPQYGLPYTGSGAEAEERVLQYLCDLPDEYFILREVRISSSEEERQAGGKEGRIDLAVIGPAIGIIILEVKDWNIRRNTYEWVDQYHVRKIDERGQVIDIRNPQAQIDGYYWKVRDLRLQSPVAIHLQGFLIFPKLTQAEFENRFIAGNNGTQHNPQKQFLINLERTLFRDDMDRYRNQPLQLLTDRLQPPLKAAYAQQVVDQIANALIPSKVRVGDPTKYDAGYQNLLVLDKKQQEWAFSQEFMKTNYMLDVAGSGKTNVLLSRAMHLIDRNDDSSDFRVLILTYSKALAKDLERMLQSKTREQHQAYNRRIAIEDIESLMEKILDQALGSAEAEKWRSLVKQELAIPEDYLEYRLPEKCQDILIEHADQFHWFDYLLVDEVRDFSSIFLDIGISLLKQRDRIFMVGDAGQKLFAREHSLSELDIVEQRVRIPGIYRMYRSPQHIARLAWSFLQHDNMLSYELREQGYASEIKPQNKVSTKPVFKSCNSREKMLEELCDDITDDIMQRIRSDRILCIGQPETLEALSAKLQRRDIETCLAPKITTDEAKLVLAEFTAAKGLERDFVYILDIDRLPDGRIDSNRLFVSDEDLEQEARRSRIKIFVALTRALREVHIYYTRHSRFVQELLELDESLRGIK